MLIYIGTNIIIFHHTHADVLIVVTQPTSTRVYVQAYACTYNYRRAKDKIMHPLEEHYYFEVWFSSGHIYLFAAGTKEIFL